MAVPKSVVSCYALAARTATPTVMSNNRSAGSRGIVVVVDTTVVPGAAPSNVVKIQGFDPISGKYYDILTSAAIVGVGTIVLRVYPGLSPSANLTVSDVLPPMWRVIVTAGNGNSATYSVAGHLIP